MMSKNAVYLGETKMLTKTDLYISCQTISNRDSSKMVLKTLVETIIIGGVFRLSLNINEYGKSRFV